MTPYHLPLPEIHSSIKDVGCTLAGLIYFTTLVLPWQLVNLGDKIQIDPARFLSCLLQIIGHIKVTPTCENSR